MISTNLMGCSTARNKGTCSNRVNSRRDAFETRVLDALRRHIMDPELFKTFCEEFTPEVNRTRIEARTTLQAARTEVKKLDREADKLLDLILAHDKGATAEPPLVNRSRISTRGCKTRSAIRLPIIR